MLREDKSASIKEGDKGSLTICICVSFIEVQTQNNRTKEQKINIYSQTEASVSNIKHTFQTART